MEFHDQHILPSPKPVPKQDQPPNLFSLLTGVTVNPVEPISDDQSNTTSVVYGLPYRFGLFWPRG